MEYQKPTTIDNTYRKRHRDNSDKYNDNLLDDRLDFEDELTNIDNINKQYLNSELNNTNNILIGNTAFSAGLYNALLNPENNQCVQNFIVDNMIKQQIQIYRHSDTIRTIYLEVELNNNMTFDELTNFEKQQLFETQFEIVIGPNKLFKSTILANLFMLYSNKENLNIKLEGNIFQIPLVDFYNITKTHIYCSEFKEYEYGLPLVSLPYHAFYVNLEFITQNLFKFMKFNIKCVYGILMDSRRKIAQMSHDYLFLNSYLESTENLNKIDIINNNTKAICIYFVSEDDTYIDYPQIESIEIYIDNKSFFIDLCDLLYMEIYDTTYIVIPFTEDFSSWTNIHRTLNNPHKYLTNKLLADIDDLKLFGLNFTLYINYESKPNNFKLKYNVISSSILLIKYGVTMLT